MNGESKNFISANLNRIDSYIKDESCKRISEETIKKYIEIDFFTNADCANVVADSLGWIAELTKSSNNLKIAVECYQWDMLLQLVKKYKEDVANEVLTNITNVIQETFNKDVVKNYVLWLGNGHIGKLLDLANGFSKYENIKLKKDIFSLLDILDWDKFSIYIDKIKKEKYNLERKLELYVILKEILEIKREDYVELVVDGDWKNLKNIIENDLGIKISTDISSIRYAIKLLKDMQKDANIPFLIQKCKEHGNVKNWLFENNTTSSVIKKIKNYGLDAELYVASGKKIAETKINGNFSQNWKEVFRIIVAKLIGSKRNKILPKVSIRNISPGCIFKKIRKNYLLALQEENKIAGKKVLSKLRNMILKSYKNKKTPKSVIEILKDIECLERVTDYGGVVSYRGAKVVAKVWKRRIPEDFYDSDRLRCCIFLPYGEKKTEMPLFMMDPQTTLVQFYVQGINEPIAAATFYIGFSKGKTALLMDTWEAGGLAYAGLPDAKMKNFVLKTMMKFCKNVGAKNLLIFAGAEYGRPEEFCGYLRSCGFESKKTHFEAIDHKDSVLKTFSSTEKHHYTDAFGSKPLRGCIKAFVFDLEN